MNKDIIKSVEKVIDYLYDDEEKHFEECSDIYQAQSSHIFKDIKKVKIWLENEANK